MSWLESNPNDFTYQGDVAAHLAKGTGPYHSLDLHRRTDRFPISLQKVVFGRFFGFDKREAWAHIMTHYPFETLTGDQIYYRRGQPMGAYSSWAMFTVCHHLIIEYAKTFDKDMVYAVLGDDVVLRGTVGPRVYKEVMSHLGVDISPLKSHVSNDTFEFRKRWFTSSVEVTPFPFNERLRRGRVVSQLSILFLDLRRKGWYLGADGQSQSIKKLLLAVGTPGGLADYLVRRVIAFKSFIQWIESEDSIFLHNQIPKTVGSAQSMCFHIDRLATCARIGLGKAIGGELKAVLDDVLKTSQSPVIRAVVDQATDSAEYSDLEPGKLALAFIGKRLREEARIYERPMYSLLKAQVVPDWAMTLGKASVKLLKVIPMGRIPNPETYMSERSAVTATRNLLRVFHSWQTFTAQFFAIRSASAQSAQRTAAQVRRAITDSQ